MSIYNSLTRSRHTLALFLSIPSCANSIHESQQNLKLKMLALQGVLPNAPSALRAALGLITVRHSELSETASQHLGARR